MFIKLQQHSTAIFAKSVRYLLEFIPKLRVVPVRAPRCGPIHPLVGRFSCHLLLDLLASFANVGHQSSMRLISRVIPLGSGQWIVAIPFSCSQGKLPPNNKVLT